MTMSRQDSLELANVFGAIANDKTRIGTSRSKAEWGRPSGRLRYLSLQELETLPFQDEIIKTAISLYPESGVDAWFNVTIADAESDEEKKLPGQLLKYLDDLGDRDDQTDAEAEAEIYSVREAFLIASISARQFGKAFILMGIDDGRDFSEPVDKKNIRSIRWLQVYDCWDMCPEWGRDIRRSPIHYRLWLQEPGQKAININPDQKIHKSRVLPFYGSRIYSRRRYVRPLRGGDGVSIIQSMFDAYLDWAQGIKAGSAMLADYDTFTLGMKGLAQLIYQDRASNSTAGQDSVKARAESLVDGKSILGGFMYDLDNELPGSVTRQYGGAHDIMEGLERRWVAVTRYPRSKLFMQGEGKGGLSEGNTAGLASRLEWALLSQVWSRHNLMPSFEQLIKYAFLAQDSPSNGKIPDSYEVDPVFDLPLTEKEEMEFEKLAAERSQILATIQAIAPEEIRTGYKGAKFSPAIILVDNPQMLQQPNNDVLKSEDQGVDNSSNKPNESKP